MKFNWRKLLSGIAKGAEIAAPILESKKPGIGKVVELGGKAAEQAAKPKEEPKK